MFFIFIFSIKYNFIFFIIIIKKLNFLKLLNYLYFILNEFFIFNLI